MASSLRPSWSTECGDLVLKTTKLANSNQAQRSRSTGHSGLHQPCLSGLKVPSPCLAAYRSAALRSQLWAGPRKLLSHRTLAAIRPCATILGEPPVPGVECQGPLGTGKRRASGEGHTSDPKGQSCRLRRAVRILSLLSLEQHVCKGTKTSEGFRAVLRHPV